MPATFRVATPDDAAQLARLGAETFRQTFGHLYPPEDLAAFLEVTHSLAAWSAVLRDSALCTWVATVETELVGYALAGPCSLPHPEVVDTAGELKRLYVTEAHQGSGLGRWLLDLSLQWLQTQQRAPVWLGVYSENVRALAVYARRGFKQVGEYAFVVGRTRDRELILRRDGSTGSE